MHTVVQDEQVVAQQNERSQRWIQLIPLSFTLVALTLNWFVIASAFSQISPEFNLDVSQLSNLIGVFILGFALMHVPGGIIAYRLGVKKTLLLGLFVESLMGALCAFAPNYEVLLFLRILAGLGAGIFVNMSFSLITSWFRGKELALAMGISAATCFSIGQALALIGWIPLSQLLGWRTAIAVAGGIGLAIWLLSLVWLRVPPGEHTQLSGRGSIAWDSVSRISINRDLWFVGLSFFGVYGAGLLTAQLLPTYLQDVYHLPNDAGAGYAAAFVLLSIPGALIGGYIAQRFHLLRSLFVWPWMALGLAVCFFPFLGWAGVLLLVVVAGAGQQFGFSAWSAMPGYYEAIRPQDVALAEGLILTVGGLGGFVIPVVFGILQLQFGYPTAFVFAGSASILFALLGFAARKPAMEKEHRGETKSPLES